jgi:hypothetical protein
MESTVRITGYVAFTAAGPTAAFLADAMKSGWSAVRALPEFGGLIPPTHDGFSTKHGVFIRLPRLFGG